VIWACAGSPFWPIFRLGRSGSDNAVPFARSHDGFLLSFCQLSIFIRSDKCINAGYLLFDNGSLLRPILIEKVEYNFNIGKKTKKRGIYE
jgi:hypothetical protein